MISKIISNKFIVIKILSFFLIIYFTKNSFLFSETKQELPSNFFEHNAGTAENPFMISNLGNLRWLSETNEFWGNEDEKYYFLQTANIDASETVNWNFGEGFRPIGYVTKFIQNYFFGDYNGDNFYIKNLFINPNKDLVFQYSTGFFSGVVNSRLSNIRLENITVTAQFDIGGLTGLAFNSTILNTSVSGTIFADENTMSVGSFVGRADSLWMEFCSSTASIIGTNKEDEYGVIGGLIGSMSSSTLKNSYFYGILNRQSVNSGGLVGFISNNSNVEYCYVSTKEILPQTIILFETDETGVFPMKFGAIASSITNGNNISNVFFDRQATGTRKGVHLSLTSKFFDRRIRGFRTFNMKRGSTYRRKGWDFDNIWAISPNINDGYPYLIDNL